MRRFRVPILGTTVMMHGRDESALIFEPELRGRLLRGDNGPRTFGMFGRLVPRELELGVLSRKVVTDAGVAFMVDDWYDGSKDITNFNAHGNGTGTTAEAVGQTALVTETGTRAAGTKSKPTAPQIRSVATISQTGTAAITEHGLFDSTTVSGSTMWDRSVFSAINVVNGDSIQFTYTLTISSGG